MVNQERRKAVHDIITTLYTEMKRLEDSHDMKSCNENLKALCGKYANNKMIKNFCNWQVIAWTPILNAIMEDGNG